MPALFHQTKNTKIPLIRLSLWIAGYIGDTRGTCYSFWFISGLLTYPCGTAKCELMFIIRGKQTTVYICRGEKIWIFVEPQDVQMKVVEHQDLQESLFTRKGGWLLSEVDPF